MSNLLAISLSAAVPLRILELKGGPVHPASLLLEKIPCPWCPEKGTCLTCQGSGRAPRNEIFGRYLGEQGDILLFGGGKKGQVATVFNAVAESLAYMAFVPGGVTVFGMHFEETWTEEQPEPPNPPGDLGWPPF